MKLLLPTILISFLFLSKVETFSLGENFVETRHHEVDYRAKLDENLVHAMTVKRMWSSARQDILDEKYKSNKANDEKEVFYIDEHDKFAQKNSLVELTSEFTVLASRELLRKIIHNYSIEDQRWVMEEKNAGSFPDLEPECTADYLDKDSPDVTCTLKFRTLEKIYGVYFDLHVAMHTKKLNLTAEEIEKRKEAIKGTTRPIHGNNIQMKATVVTPSKFTKSMNSKEMSLSEYVLRNMVIRCSSFLATPAPPQATITEYDSPPIYIIDRDEWATTVHTKREKAKKDSIEDEMFFSVGRHATAEVIRAVARDPALYADHSKPEVVRDTNPLEENDGIDGLFEYLETLDEENGSEDCGSDDYEEDQDEEEYYDTDISVSILDIEREINNNSGFYDEL